MWRLDIINDNKLTPCFFLLLLCLRPVVWSVIVLLA